MMATNEQIVAAVQAYDAAMADVTKAREGLRDAERELKRIVGAKHDVYMDGNELVAALGRKLVENLTNEGT